MPPLTASTLRRRSYQIRSRAVNSKWLIVIGRSSSREVFGYAHPWSARGFCGLPPSVRKGSVFPEAFFEYVGYASDEAQPLWTIGDGSVKHSLTARNAAEPLP